MCIQLSTWMVDKKKNMQTHSLRARATLPDPPLWKIHKKVLSLSLSLSVSLYRIFVNTKETFFVFLKEVQLK